jgi:predicted nucleic acid-binding protein
LNFLLDTNVVSEWVKPRPNANVVRWLAETDEDRVFLSVITFAEIRFGIEGMMAGWGGMDSRGGCRSSFISPKLYTERKRDEVLAFDDVAVDPFEYLSEPEFSAGDRTHHEFESRDGIDCQVESVN